MAESLERTSLGESGATDRYTLGHGRTQHPGEHYSRAKRKEDWQACGHFSCGNCPKLQAFQGKQDLEVQSGVGSLGADPGA